MSITKNVFTLCAAFFAATLLSAGSASAYEREIENLATILQNSMIKTGKKTVAVIDFTDLQGNVTELGRFIAEELSGTLAGTAQGIEVIDRNHLKSIIAEHKLSMSGLVNPNTVKQVGQISGADVLVSGTITPFGDSIHVACKAIDAASTRVVGSAKGDIAKTATLSELLNMAVQSGGGQTGGGAGQQTADSSGQQRARGKVAEGDYHAAGRNPNGSKYSGLVTISRKGESYYFVWKIGSTTYSGMGRLQGRTLSVDWGDKYPVIYRLEDDGRLAGTWSNGAAEETLTPVR